MKLRNEILAFGLFGALTAAALGGIGLWTASRLGEVIEATLASSESLQASQSVDMMHDALRGDAQLAMLGALTKDPGRIDAAQKAFKEHQGVMAEGFKVMEARPMSEATRDALGKARPAVARYQAAVDQAIRAALTGQDDAAQLESTAKEVQQRFTELEGMLDAVSRSVEERGHALNDRARAREVQARVAVLVGLLASVAAMIAVGLWVAARMTRPMRHAVSVAEQLAQGRLGARIRPQGNDETRAMLGAMGTMQSRLASIVREVKHNADHVATASAQIAQGNQDLSTRTERQASALQQTAATMDELSATLRTSADHARLADQLVRGASDVATRGGAMMDEVVQTMKGINESSRQIGDIIGVIDGIAFQTNILALNAAVEAARAGEQGRGFAVVAGEVRSLAQRSAEAARQIKALISTSVERVEAGSGVVDRAGQTMDEIVGAIGKVTDIVAGISAATQEQSTGVGQVTHAVSDMDQTTQQNAALVEESAAAAESLRQQSEHLVAAVAVFETDGTYEAHAT